MVARNNRNISTNNSSPALTTNVTEIVNDDEMGYFAMSLRLMPKAARERFKKLKAQGKVVGTMNDYMRNAFLQQLKRDEQA